MTDVNMPPHMTVSVNHSNNDYVNSCDHYGGGFELLDHWKALGDLLAHRSGWYFEIVNRGEALWCFGAFGQSLLNIHVTATGLFHCYDVVEDSDFEARTVGEIETWLENGREESRSGPTTAALRMASDDNWLALKRLPITVSVSWFDGWFAAGIEKLPQDVVFDRSLVAVVKAARLLVTSFFGAPESVADELNVSVQLDRAATETFITS